MDSSRRLLLRRRLLIAAALAGGWAVACSPEDGRKRGEAGADIGNKPDASNEVELHGKENPDYQVPNLLPPAERTGKK